MTHQPMHFGTAVIHAGQAPDPVTGAVMPSIVTSSTYKQHAPGEHTGFEYSRSQNPTRFALERMLAELEGGQHGFGFASGLAAISTVLEILNSGDHVVAMDDLYGGSSRLFRQVRHRSAGLDFSFVDLSDTKLFLQAIRPETRMVWIETPTNPLLKLVDIANIAQIAKARDIIVVVDNTFATPFNQQPLKLGADIVVHSMTKYLNGHSDMIGGAAIVGDNKELGEQLKFLQNSTGAIVGPFDSYLALRGIKTLALRMRTHNDNAMAIAEWLSTHQAVEQVIYPGLSSHPQHDLAKTQMNGFSGVVSVQLKGGAKEANQFLSHLTLFTLAESLGGVESLIEQPATMTHAGIPADIRAELGISDSLIRLSVGIEDKEDLIHDLQTALASIAQ